MTNETRRGIIYVLILSVLLSPLVEARRLGNGGSRGISRPSYSSGSYSSNSSSRSYSIGRSHSNNNNAIASRRLGGGDNRGLTRPSNESSRSGNQSSINRSRYDSDWTQKNNSIRQRQSNGLGRTIAAGATGTVLGMLAGHSMANANNSNHTAHSKNNMDDQAYIENTSQSINNTDNPVDQKQTNVAPARQSRFSLFWLIIFGLIGFYIYRRLVAKKNQNSISYHNHLNREYYPPKSNQFSYNSSQTNIFGQKLSDAFHHHSTDFNMADGSDSQAFLRFSHQRFNHVQAMNKATNVEEIRPYFTPDMYAAIRSDIMQNQDVAEFYDLHSELIESVKENGMYIASVRFSGMVSDELASEKESFSEVWHFVKPVGSHQEWLIAGIQQDN